MYKKKTKLGLVFSITLLLIIEFIVLFLMSKTLLKSANSNLLEDRSLEKNRMIAIMLETSDGTYVQSNDSKWPTDMVYNNERSGCIDNYGNIIENALFYDEETNLATVYTETTGDCYLYFDLKDEEQ